MRQILAFAIFLILVSAAGGADPGETEVLNSILKGLSNGEVLGWGAGDACGWKHITCRGQSIVAIGAESLGLRGTLSAEISKLSNLEHLGFQFNGLSGPLPSISGLKNLQKVYLNSNNFSSIPPDFFSGLDSLSYIYLDHNPLSSWSLSKDVQSSTKLVNLSLTNTSLSGKIPDFLGQMSSLRVLNLAYNSLTGSLPATFAGSGLTQLEVNNMALEGPIDVVGSMPSISQLWLHMNEFNGTIPAGLSNASSLVDLRLNNNKLTGLVPDLRGLPLTGFNVADNNLLGPIPSVDVSTKDAFVNNKFCQTQAGKPCPADVNSVLSFLTGVGFPDSLISSWTGTEACSLQGVICKINSVVVVGLNYPNSQLAGTISPGIAGLASLQSITLSNNRLTGSIPPELATLKSLQKLDLRNNSLAGPMVKFDPSVNVLLDGNPLLNSPPGSPPGPTVPVPVPSQVPPPPLKSKPETPAPTANAPPGGTVPVLRPPPHTFNDTSRPESSKSSVPTVVVVAVAGVSLALVSGAVIFLLCCKQRKGKGGDPVNGGMVVYPSSDPDINVNVSRGSGGGTVSGPSGDVHVVESGNMIISIQVLRHATKNFSEETILGRGGFGVVYKGVLDDGTSIAVKRMEASMVVSSKGLSEFQAEIAVLTKVRHRHLVALLGYCIEGNEKLLVYEYLPKGTLGQHLFENEKLGYKTLDWKKRLVIALDVARGMEYLHGLAHKSFIHRDLKPSNILLDDDYRAKVSDFGLVKLAPEGKHSIETRLAGTFGYLAPEYAVTGRVTTKADVFSFGVVLMELITGRKALDETQAEENMHLVTWFRRTNQSRESFLQIIDPALEATEDKVESIYKVAELAKHCTAREPYNRPDMGHAVSVLAPLVEQWKPTDTEGDESKGIDLNISLPQALKQWQASDDCNLDDSQASLPTRPVGFADSFTSTDAR